MTSFLLVFAKRKWPSLANTEWLLFAWGAIMTLPAAISGVAAHEIYEEMPIHTTIDNHALPANIGTLLMLVIVVWRWRSRRGDLTTEIGNRPWYLAFAAISLLWIFVVGGHGWIANV